MDDMRIEKALDLLMADEDLVALCELQRTGEDVLDVISLNENQHSDILGWLLDPREGHGQGDQILRDLLIAASTKITSGESGLDGRSSTAKFFKEWKTSKIRTTGFGSAFYARELGMKPTERVDLFVIDPQNNFIILLENKAGTGHRSEQLQQYRDSFVAIVKENAHLREYSHVYIALDRDFDNEDDARRPCDETWLHLGYEWLKASAGRALLHVERGNTSAKLVLSYCNRQTGWESPEMAKCNKLAALLHQRHPTAIKELIKAPSVRIENNWLCTKRPPSSLLFSLQNRSVIKLLRSTRGMIFVKTELQSFQPELSPSSIEHTRAYLNLCPMGWEQPKGEYWPLYINIRFSDKEKTKFRIRLIWNSEAICDAHQSSNLRRRLTELDPRFGLFTERRYRRVPVGKGLSIGDLMKKVEELTIKLREIAPS